MATLGQINELRAHVAVSYEDAKNALEESNGDLVDAIIRLEREGKTAPHVKDATASDDAHGRKKSQGFSRAMGRLGGWLVQACKWLYHTSLEVTRQDTIFANIPLLWVLVLVAITHGVGLLAIAVGLFFGCRYQLVGAGATESANQALERVSIAAEQLKEDVRSPQ